MTDGADQNTLPKQYWGVEANRNRHGRMRWYFREPSNKTTPRIRLPDSYGSPDFEGAWRACATSPRDPRFRHGHARRGATTRVYAVWSAMIQRCTNPNDKDFDRYGGRGITVCDRWLHSFEDFYADMGERPPGLTLDRRDNEGNYEPGNYRWATWLEQAHNRGGRLR
jgi:hypothetical protein